MMQKIRSFIFDKLIFIPNPKQFSDDDNLLDAGLDSMGIMRLVMFIETEFNLNLPDAEIEPDNVQSINALQTWIERHQNSNSFI